MVFQYGEDDNKTQILYSLNLDQKAVVFGKTLAEGGGDAEDRITESLCRKFTNIVSMADSIQSLDESI